MATDRVFWGLLQNHQWMREDAEREVDMVGWVEKALEWRRENKEKVEREKEEKAREKEGAAAVAASS